MKGGEPCEFHAGESPDWRQHAARRRRPPPACVPREGSDIAVILFRTGTTLARRFHIVRQFGRSACGHSCPACGWNAAILERFCEPVLAIGPRSKPMRLSSHRRALALVPDAQDRLPHFPKEEGAGHHRTDLYGIGFHRFLAEALWRFRGARVLRSIP